MHPGPAAWGCWSARLAVAATTALIFPLREITPSVSNGVVYMLAVLLVSTYWGLGLGLLTALASAVSFNFFHIPPTGELSIADAQNYVALGVFLAAAAIASTVADLARSRALEAERRRQEADLAADLARLLLAGANLDDALGEASQRLATALDLPSVALELRRVEGEERRHMLPLSIGEGREATLLVPASIDPSTLERLRERVLPSLEALLGAALDRDELQSEVVETRALRYSDSLKTALLRSVSHDLRTPLTAIVAASAALDSPSLDPSERQEILAGSVSRRAACLALSTSSSTSLASRPGPLSRDATGARSRSSSAMPWTSLVTATPAAISSPSRSGPACRWSRSTRCSSSAPSSTCWRTRNAIRGGHEIKVRAGAIGERVVIRIVDRGPGIPHSQLSHIFEPFYRLADDGEHPGSGLGLAIARGFVEANDGRLTAESLPGQGTTFVIELPVKAP